MSKLFDRNEYLYYYFRNKVRKKIITGLKPKHFNRILSEEDSQKIVSEKIESGSPFVVCRFGSNELETISECVGKKLGLRKLQPLTRNLLCGIAGFFPNEEKNIDDFSRLMLEKAKEVDVLNCFKWELEDYIVHKYMPNTTLGNFNTVEPYYTNNGWSKSLKGKKVLVVHPFAETIKKQYKNRDKLFKNDLLPEFELITYKAIQTIGGKCEDKRFNSWFDVLNFMREEIKKIDFDIALVGCGAYGFPLSVMIKEDGKQAIHMGGALQILFGIKGKRWDEHPVISKLYNDYWVRPSEEEKPKEFNNFEGGCYW